MNKPNVPRKIMTKLNMIVVVSVCDEPLLSDDGDALDDDAGDEDDGGVV